MLSSRWCPSWANRGSLQIPVEISMGHRRDDDRSVRHTISVCPNTSPLLLRFGDRARPIRPISHLSWVRWDIDYETATQTPIARYGPAEHASPKRRLGNGRL